MAQSREIGSRYNEWRHPVFELGPGEDDLQAQIRRAVGNINIPEDTWITHCKTVDKVLSVILREIKNAAARHYPGLNIRNDVIRQGSSREGLKVLGADEYDCILPFEIQGLTTRQVSVIGRDGRQVPGLTKLFVPNAQAMRDRFPWIEREKIIDDRGMMNSMQLQKILFSSLLDKALSKINGTLKEESDRGGNAYHVVRSVHSTNLHLTIQFEQGQFGGLFDVMHTMPQDYAQIQGLGRRQVSRIDLDLVPGMFISKDYIPDPYTVRGPVQNMPCVRHVVTKWLSKKNPNIDPADTNLLWRNDSCGYEIHIMDVARRSRGQRYFLTACRILKAYMVKEKESFSNNQLPRLLKSYHLKNICLYCIVFFTVPSSSCNVSGVREALGYMIKFLEWGLHSHYLPHFFHGNPWLSALIPGCFFENDLNRFNLLCTADREKMRQATYGIEPMKRALSGLYTETRYTSEKEELFRDMLN